MQGLIYGSPHLFRRYEMREFFKEGLEKTAQRVGTQMVLFNRNFKMGHCSKEDRFCSYREHGVDPKARIFRVFIELFEEQKAEIKGLL